MQRGSHLLHGLVLRDTVRIHLPVLRWTEPARTFQVVIGPIQVEFSLPHESHCDSKASENPT